jgi:hypothetical protein
MMSELSNPSPAEVTDASDDLRTRMAAKERALKSHVDGMLDYLRLKMAIGDMHATMDASADIRELTAQIEVIRELRGTES